MLSARCIYSFVLFSSAIVAQQESPGLANRDQRYRLQPQDVIEVHYRYTPEYDQTATVQPDGFVTLILLGGVKLAGLTLDQAKSELAERAAKRLRDPEVSLLLKDYVKPHFAVAGEVTTPGRFELRGQITAVEAIAMAGGFKTPSAKHSQVILYRRSGPEMAEARILDMKQMMRPNGLKENLDIQPGDLLVVPQNQISKIERFVKWANVGMYFNPLP